MAKLLLILLIGLVFESAGVVLLKKGMSQVDGVGSIRLPEIARVVKAGLTSPQILLGVFFEALFFLSLLILLARADISFLWPLTGLSFVFATLAAVIFLHEHVSGLRWAGVVLVMIGAALISYSEHQRDVPPSAPQQNATSAR
jgi:drug/metabolite transporter (DMT)-like permease